MVKYGNLVKGNTPAFERKQPVTDKDIEKPSEISPKISSEISPSVESYADVVRRAVRWPGKESAPLRITPEELNQLKAAVRYFEDKGYLTDRTQLIRVALNYMLWDFDNNNEKSLLNEILERINTY